MLRITPVAEAVPPSPVPAAAVAEDTGAAAATTVDSAGPSEVAKVDVKVQATRKKSIFIMGFSVLQNRIPSDPYVLGLLDPDSSIIKQK